MHPDSLELVQRVSNGDVHAVEELLGRYLPDIRTYVARHAGELVRARESAADLAQSVCREALERLRDGRLAFRGEPQFKQWLYRAALMKILNRQRFWQADRRAEVHGARAAHPPASDAGDAPDVVDPRATPAQAALVQDELDRFARLFDQLPEDYREAIAWHHIEGLGHEEFAAQKGISVSYSRALLSRALARLAKLG